jgi:hypothetical protein
MGFTHCETGKALSEKWTLADDIVDVIAHHHAVEQSSTSQSLLALVHLSDLLCRMRDLGYGYYERHKVDLASDPAWEILLREHRELRTVAWCDSPLSWMKQWKKFTPWWPQFSGRSQLHNIDNRALLFAFTA